MADRYTHFTNLAYTGKLAYGEKGSEVPIAAGWDPATSTITVGTESSNVVNVAVQFNDVTATAMTEPVSAFIYFSDDALGQTVTSDPFDTLAVGTDGTIIVAYTAGAVVQAVSEADGDLDLDCTQSAADTVYMNIVAPDGTLLTSSVLTFT